MGKASWGLGCFEGDGVVARLHSRQLSGCDFRLASAGNWGLGLPRLLRGPRRGVGAGEHGGGARQAACKYKPGRR